MKKLIIYVLLLASFQTFAQDTKVTITGGAIGGSGISSVTAQNGLSNVNDSTIKLGGTLIENTAINGDYANTFTFYNLSNFTAAVVDTSTFSSGDNSILNMLPAYATLQALRFTTDTTIAATTVTLSDSTFTVESYKNITPTSGFHSFLNILPNSVELKRQKVVNSITENVNPRLVYAPDTLLTSPTMVYVKDADTMKVYPISSLVSGVTSVSGTANRITSTGGTTPVINISAAYVGQTSLTTLGTVTTGTLSTGAVIGGVTMTLGSDAQGDIYYRNGSGILTRLAAGTSSQILHSGTTPSWKDTTAITATTGWSILGNAGTSRSTNFMGSTDDVAVSFRQNNVFRMQLDTNGRSNLFVGNMPGIAWPGKANILIWDTLRDAVSNISDIGLMVVKQVYKKTGDATAGDIFAGSFEPRIDGQNTADWTGTNYGLVGVRASNNIQTGATGTLARAQSIQVAADYAGMTITNRYGIIIENPTVSGTAVLTRNYGLYIMNQTASSLPSNNYGFWSNSYNNVISPAAQLSSSGTSPTFALQVVATQAATPPGNQYAVDFEITGAGSAGTLNSALKVNYLAGYTGSQGNFAIYGDNSNVGTGTSITGFTNNIGVLTRSLGVTAGTNIGISAVASGGTISIGSIGKSVATKNSGKNIGVMGFGLNAGTTPFEIGGAFYLQSTDPTINVSSALLADNGGEAVNILTLRDNATTVMAVVDGGAVAIGAATATDKLEVTGNIALMAAGNKLKIASGSNASIGTATLSGGTVTVNTTAVTASSIIFLTDATTGVLTNIGTPTVGTIVAGTSFVINSSNVLDTSAVNWIIIN